MPNGMLILDIEGTILTDEDKTLIANPLVSGVLLFSRNYENRQQLKALTAEIRSIRAQPLFICVDQEGGRVQRFKFEFEALPPLRVLGRHFAENPTYAVQSAQQLAWIMASELQVCGVDFSFAPVLDLDFGQSDIIGTRSFSNSVEQVSRLGAAYCQGMHSAGMATVGKHFPGHGYVVADSHLELPVDERNEREIFRQDVIPFQLLAQGHLDGLMMAHIIYSAMDALPAGFSPFWLQTCLRKKMGYSGLIFSDDLTMKATRAYGDAASCARLALDAGCDQILICNDRPAVIAALEALADYPEPSGLAARMRPFYKGGELSESQLYRSAAWQMAKETLDHWANLAASTSEY